MITTILFDFDGTIADTLPAIVEIGRQIGPQYGVKHADKIQLEDLKDKSVLQLLKLLEIPLYKIPFILNHGRELLEKNLHKVKPHAGMLPLIKKLHENGYRLGILSSNSTKIINKFLSIHKITYFDFVHSEKNLFGKGQALVNLLKTYNLEKDTVLYLGDELRDIDACDKAGVRIVSVTWGFNSKKVLQKHNKKYVIDEPEQLLKILDK